MEPDGLSLTVGGIVIVFTVLALISAVVGMMRRLDDRLSPPREVPTAGVAGQSSGIDDTTLVLITAAVATLVKGRHRIRGLRRLMPADRPGSLRCRNSRGGVVR